MATSTITGTTTDPSGGVVAGARVVARLLPTPGFRISDSSEIANEVETDTNGSGVWTLALERQSNITPANTFYEITEYVPDGGRVRRRAWNISVPNVDSTLLAAIITPTGPNPPYETSTAAVATAVAAHVIANPAHAAAVVSNTPAGTIAATNVQAALNELDTEKSATTHTHSGTTVANTPAGNIAATNVQAAINELDAEKIGRLGGTTATVAGITYLNVKDYGAVGNGSTDDTAAIQAAIDAAAAATYGGQVFFPFGQYKTTNNLVLKTNVALLGMGGVGWPFRFPQNVCTIMPSATFAGDCAISILGKDITSSVGNEGHVRIEHLNLSGQNLPAGSVDGIHAQGEVMDVILKNVTIKLFTHNGVWTNIGSGTANPHDWFMDSVVCYQNANYGFSMGITDGYIRNCIASSSGVDGWLLGPFTSLTMDSCQALFNTGHGMNIAGGNSVGGVSVNSFLTDRNGKDGIHCGPNAAAGAPPIIFSGLSLRRDGRNGNSGGGGYAGFSANGCANPIIIEGLVVNTGHDDDGSGTNSPQYGIALSGNAYVAVGSGYVHGNTTGWYDDGTNTVVRRGINVGEATGSTTTPTFVYGNGISVSNSGTRITYGAGAVRTGLAKISAGATQWGIPGAVFTAVGTTALVVNEDRYVPLKVEYPITLTAWELEVSTAPASNANFKLAIYPADGDQQPPAATAPLYDSGSIAVASGFTGTKTATGLTVALAAGTYLVAINCDVAMTLRTFTSGALAVAAALGATPFIQRMSVARAFAAFPTPGTKWTAVSASAGGLQNFAVWQWTEAA